MLAEPEFLTCLGRMQHVAKMMVSSHSLIESLLYFILI